MLVFVGSAGQGTPYLKDPSKGTGVVSSFLLNADGQLALGASPVAVGANPTAIVSHSKMTGLIISSETYGEANSTVCAVAVDDPATGALRVLNSVDAGGRACCHLALHPGGKHVAWSNYLGESVDPGNRGTFGICEIGQGGSLQSRTAHVAHEGTLPGACDLDMAQGPARGRRGSILRWSENNKTTRTGALENRATRVDATQGTQCCYWRAIWDWISGNSARDKAEGANLTGTSRPARRRSQTQIQRQEAGHCHASLFVPMEASGKYAMFVCDLGLDQVFQYVVGADGAAVPNPSAPSVVASEAGAGPRWGAAHPSRPYVYILNEMNSTIQAHAFDAAAGSLSEKPLQVVSSFTAGHERAGDDTYSNAAGLKVHPSGRFLYCSNRGHDSIGIFKVGDDGLLTYLACEMTGGFNVCGMGPRDFDVSPCGKFLVLGNQDNDTIVSYSIDLETGLLAKACEVACVAPVCIRVASP